MSTTFSVLTLASATCLSMGLATPAFAQVSDSQRAGARDLFKAGDQLQRSGQFADALDKFQRAQQVFPAPTNVLRIAECDAALGRLVESAEAYREVLRTPLPAGAPPAFQAAVDQAKAELSQVDPRVPKLTVVVQPAGVQGPQMQIDGQSVPAALIGEPMPLDPGVHKLAVIAPGYASTEQSVELKEHDAKSVNVTLNAIPGVTYAAGTTPVPAAPPVASGDTPPPPPALESPDLGPPPKRSSAGLLLGAHLGFEGVSGSVPTPDEGFASPSSVGAGGLAFGLDAGFRFARQFSVGLTLDRANFTNSKPSQLINDATASSSNTTLLSLVGAFIANPDKVSFYADLSLGNRWYDVRETFANGPGPHQQYNAGEIALGLGIWIPAGRSFRFLPKITFGFDSFSDGSSPANTTSTTTDSSQNKIATFTTLSLVGLYNLDF
jgi:hypothetical protein